MIVLHPFASGRRQPVALLHARIVDPASERETLGGVLTENGVIRALGAEVTRDQLDYLCYGRVMDTTRMRSELGFEPKWTTLEAFDDFVKGRGLTPIVDPDWVRSAEGRALALAQRWGGVLEKLGV